MKKILLLVSLAFVSLLVCANPEDDRGVPMRAQGACPPVHTIDSVVIRQVPWHITTSSSVTCYDFEKDFSYMEYHILDSFLISDLVRKISVLKRSNSKSLDVRCKMYFYSSGKIYKSVCIDAAHVLYNGELYLLSPSLKKTIDRITKYKRGRRVKMNILRDLDIPFPCGRDSLNRYLLSQSEDLYKYIDKPITLVVICQINSQGETLNVKIKNKDSSPINDETKRLFEKIIDIFINDVKWIPNIERFPYETVSIPVKFL